MKLFATDLDGTLLLPGDAIHPNDVAAIRAAREQGVIVTLATGRLTSRTHHVARSLGLDAPLVCADGGIISCGQTERIFARRGVHRELSVQLLELFQQSELASFVFTPDAIHSCTLGSLHHAFVRGWATNVTTHRDLLRGAFRDHDDAIMLLGIGEQAASAEMQAQLATYDDFVDVFRFELGGVQVVRLLARGTSKGAALAELAAQEDIAREDVAVIGDWLNDLSMFAYAGRSFAMPHAPQELRENATDQLDESALEQGPIATALRRLGIAVL